MKQTLGEDRWGQRAELLGLIDQADHLIATPDRATAQGQRMTVGP
ncbi:hypothetical protein [Agrilutibacter solisilvae]|nr:hypothetical protein [Lysobacter solisilvae]